MNLYEVQAQNLRTLLEIEVYAVADDFQKAYNYAIETIVKNHSCRKENVVVNTITLLAKETKGPGDTHFVVQKELPYELVQKGSPAALSHSAAGPWRQPIEIAPYDKPILVLSIDRTAVVALRISNDRFITLFGDKIEKESLEKWAELNI